VERWAGNREGFNHGGTAGSYGGHEFLTLIPVSNKAKPLNEVEQISLY